MSYYTRTLKGAPQDAPRCAGCNWPLWNLATAERDVDPLWEGRNHERGKPATVITNADETKEVDACIECANDRPTYDRIREAAGLGEAK